jgi:large subunit ribosomal protein L35
MPKMKTKSAAKKRFSLHGQRPCEGRRGRQAPRHDQAHDEIRPRRIGTMILSDSDEKIVKKYMPYNR